jgi:hypothetical protein
MPYKVHLLKAHPSITVHNDYTWIVTGCEEAALHAWASKTENAVIAHICSGKRVKLSWQLVVWANSDPPVSIMPFSDLLKVVARFDMTGELGDLEGTGWSGAFRHFSSTQTYCAYRGSRGEL